MGKPGVPLSPFRFYAFFFPFLLLFLFLFLFRNSFAALSQLFHSSSAVSFLFSFSCSFSLSLSLFLSLSLSLFLSLTWDLGKMWQRLEALAPSIRRKIFHPACYFDQLVLSGEFEDSCG